MFSSSSVSEQAQNYLQGIDRLERDNQSRQPSYNKNLSSSNLTFCSNRPSLDSNPPSHLPSLEPTTTASRKPTVPHFQTYRAPKAPRMVATGSFGGKAKGDNGGRSR